MDFLHLTAIKVTCYGDLGAVVHVAQFCLPRRFHVALDRSLQAFRKCLRSVCKSTTADCRARNIAFNTAMEKELKCGS
uniref:Uncharacterized protein n=1 Tax=Ditylenchus dipsaci TaxID=166011 RepID=A0A915CZG5_9BILA